MFVHFVPVKLLKRADIGRRKILKVIPDGIFRESKALRYYIINDFKSDAGQLKDLL